METIGNRDLVPAARRVGGPGSNYLMVPLTHVSPDRPSRSTNGSYGVPYAADRLETSLAEITKFWRTRHDSNVWPLPSEGNALSS